MVSIRPHQLNDSTGGVLALVNILAYDQTLMCFLILDMHQLSIYMS